jgi:hypothetical protein
MGSRNEPYQHTRTTADTTAAALARRKANSIRLALRLEGLLKAVNPYPKHGIAAQVKNFNCEFSTIVLSIETRVLFILFI